MSERGINNSVMIFNKQTTFHSGLVMFPSKKHDLHRSRDNNYSPFETNFVE